MSLQRGRGTCLGITRALVDAVNEENGPSKRPRHVPRNHQNISSWFSRADCASKRPRHVPRNHPRNGIPPSDSYNRFKEAEARASESPKRFYFLLVSSERSFKEAEARASESPPRMRYRFNPKISFKEAEARASESPRRDRIHKFIITQLQRGRGTCLGITYDFRIWNGYEWSGFKEAEARASESPSFWSRSRTKANGASKRPRHVPRNHRQAIRT